MNPRPPLVPEDRIHDPNVGVGSLVRAALAVARAAFDRGAKPFDLARQTWPDDRVAPLVVRSAVSPDALTSSAASLAGTLVTDFLVVLGPSSIAAQLLVQGLQVKFGHMGVISVPGLVMDGNGVSFVGEGLPAPVHQFTTTRVQLQPHKLVSLIVRSCPRTESTIPTSARRAGHARRASAHHRVGA
jgi:hypothetical protein